MEGKEIQKKLDKLQKIILEFVEDNFEFDEVMVLSDVHLFSHVDDSRPHSLNLVWGVLDLELLPVSLIHHARNHRRIIKEASLVGPDETIRKSKDFNQLSADELLEIFKKNL